MNDTPSVEKYAMQLLGLVARAGAGRSVTKKQLHDLRREGEEVKNVLARAGGEGE